MKRKVFLGVLVLVTMLLAACAAPTPEIIEKEVVVEKKVVETVVVEKEVVVVVTATPVPPAPTPAGPVGTLTVGMPGDVVGLDPHIHLMSIDQSVLLINLYDRVVWYNFEGEPQGLLLESWKNLSDTEWELRLRGGVTFHNGEPWNAEAFVWNWTRTLDSGEPRHARLESLAQSGTAEVIDEYTVKITTAQPDPLLLDNMSNYFMIAPQYVEEVGDDAFAEKPVGTGPFRFVEWVKGDHLTLEANLDYWGGAPKVKTLILRPISEVATRIAALQAGEVDLIMAVPTDRVQTLESDPDITVIAAPINGVVYVQMFPDSPKGGGEPLNDVGVRQALNYAVNVDEIIEFLLSGYGKRAATIVNSSAFGFDPDLEPYPYDPDKAKELLAEAGYPNGFTIGFDLASLGTPNDLLVIQAVIADWAEVGINVELNQMETAAIVPLKLEFEIAPLFYWYFRGFDADGVLYRQLHSSGAWFYYAGWTPEVDELLDAQHTNVDREARLAILKQFQAKFKEDAPYVSLYEPMSIYALNNRVVGFVPQPKDTLFLGDTAVVD